MLSSLVIEIEILSLTYTNEKSMRRKNQKPILILPTLQVRVTKTICLIIKH